MSLQAQGAILRIEPTKQITATFKKRELILTIEDGKYPQTCSFEVTGDRCEKLDEYAIGDVVSIDFNLRGREWTSPKGEVRVFNSLDAWRIEKAMDTVAQSAPQPPAEDQGIPF
jgi:hypothetical protein